MQNKEIENSIESKIDNDELFNIKEIKYLLNNHINIIYYNDTVIETLNKSVLQYIDQLENKIKELGKGQHTLMQSRRKWKNRYYKNKTKDITNKYMFMIEAFECDFIGARNGEYNLVQLQQNINDKEFGITRDIDLLQELSFNLRYNKAKIISNE